MTLRIEMVSDLVCPWCWLGLRRLEAARAMVPEIEVDVYFRPYQLDPTVPENGQNYRDYMKAKFGPEGKGTAKSRWQQMREALENYGMAEDIPFDFSGITIRPNTTNAHRLVHWAQGQGKGMAAKEVLFTAYFKDHRDIGDLEVLIDIAGAIGLDKAIVRDLLSSEADRQTVADEANLFLQMGVRGVPTFIAERRLAIQGAETPEKIADLIRTAAANASGGTA